MKDNEGCCGCLVFLVMLGCASALDILDPILGPIIDGSITLLGWGVIIFVILVILVILGTIFGD